MKVLITSSFYPPRKHYCLRVKNKLKLSYNYKIAKVWQTNRVYFCIFNFRP